MSRKKNKPVKKRKQSVNQKRYHSIQKYLSAATKKENIKLGKSFNSFASLILKKTKDKKLSFLRKNILVYYNDIIRDGATTKTLSEDVFEKEPFPDSFPYYDFTSLLKLPVFEGVEVTVVFDDDKLSAKTTGFGLDIDDWYIRNLHSHLRTYYNKSPVATFKLKEFVEEESCTYEVETNNEIFTPIDTGKTIKTNDSRDVDRQIKLIQEKTKAVERLKELGLSMEEIKKYLGI